MRRSLKAPGQRESVGINGDVVVPDRSPRDGLIGGERTQRHGLVAAHHAAGGEAQRLGKALVAI